LNSAARIKKEKNQARDVRLKAESAGKKRVPDLQLESPGGNTRKKQGKAKDQVLDVEEERIRLERRMERAMAAAEEDDESGDTEDDSDILMNEGEANSTTEEENEDTEVMEQRSPSILTTSRNTTLNSLCHLQRLLLPLQRPRNRP
jgi:hypothetical protein